MWLMILLSRGVELRFKNPVIPQYLWITGSRNSFLPHCGYQNPQMHKSFTKNGGIQLVLLKHHSQGIKCDPGLVETASAEPVDPEDQLCQSTNNSPFHTMQMWLLSDLQQWMLFAESICKIICHYCSATLSFYL